MHLFLWSYNSYQSCAAITTNSERFHTRKETLYPFMLPLIAITGILWIAVNLLHLCFLGISINILNSPLWINASLISIMHKNFVSI